MLESSPSVSEVANRLRRFLPVVGLEGCSLDANYSSLILSYWGQNEPAPITTMREVHVSDPHLERLWGAESLLDQIEAGTVGLHDAYDHLRRLERAPRIPRSYTRLAVMLSVAGWVLFLDGSGFATFLVALLASQLALPADRFVAVLRLPAVASQFTAAAIIAAVPNLVAAAGVDLQVGRAVVGALFLYLPGRALVSSVIDGLSGSPVSALARGVQALVTAGSLAMGMLVGTSIGEGLGLNYTPDGTATPLLVSVLGAAVGMLGVALLWGMPLRFVPTTLAIGAIGWLVVALMSAGGPSKGTGWTSYALAAGVVGLLSGLVASAQRSSPSIYAGVAILPLVPGFTLYRGVLALSQGKRAAAVDAFAEAGVLSLAIAIGVALGLAFGADLIRTRRRLPRGRQGS